jgi:MFS family permease
LLLISESAAWGLGSAPLLVSAAAAAILLPGFFWRERRTPAPLIDPGLFGSAAFAGGIVAIMLSYALLYGMFFLISFALVRGYHDDPLSAGVRLAIVPVALGIVAPFTGQLQSRFGLRPLLLGGMVLCVAALLTLISTMNGSPGSLNYVMSALALFGAGLGLFIAPNNSATISSAPADHRGQAGGLLNLMRVFGTSFGVACSAAVLSWRLATYAHPADHTVGVDALDLLAAISSGMWLLIGFAVLTALASLLQGGEAPEAAAKG